MKKKLRDYLTMLVIRYFEERVEDLFSRGLIKGTAHPCVGQEASAVGVSSALRKSDYLTSTHRGHGHFIAHGGDPNRIMAELFGKETGYSRGRGGSQLMADFKLGFLGANGITGGSIPVATGVGLSIKQRKDDRVVACFFGDGAANQGTFHESLNMAAIWQLPVLYICENNSYAMSTHVSQSMAIENVSERAASYGIPGVTVDGNDLDAIRQCVTAAAKRARRWEGPTLIECRTYRLSGHSRGDPRHYRSREEEAAHRKLDPIPRYRKHLIESGVMDSKEGARLRKDAIMIVREAVAFAKQSKYPDPATLVEGVFA